MRHCEIEIPENPIIAGHYIQDALLEDDIKYIHVKPNRMLLSYIFSDESFSISDYWSECAKRIGSPVPMEEDSKGNKTGSLFTDIKYPSNKKSESFSYSNTRQPLHTDGSYESKAPNTTYFFCMKESLYGGSTTFILLEELKKYIEIYDRELLNKIQNTEVIHSKGDDFKSRPILSDNKLTWNYYRCNDVPIRNEFHNFLESYIVGGDLCQSVKLKFGEALFFKDEELLHGRTAFLGERWLVKGGINV